MESRYNTRSPAVKRLMREAQELSQATDQYFAQPLEDNLFEWHFTVRGPSDSDFQNGIYHGRIILPVDYPMKPPSIIWLTPNGRFETNKKICLSISGHHPESWQPSWSIRTALLAIIGFMPTHPNGAIGSLDYTPEERKILSKKSKDWKCPVCGDISTVLLEPNSESIVTEKEAKELATQINFQAEKPKNNDGNCFGGNAAISTACTTTAQSDALQFSPHPICSAYTTAPSALPCSNQTPAPQPQSLWTTVYGVMPNLPTDVPTSGNNNPPVFNSQYLSNLPAGSGISSLPRFPYPPSYYSQCGYSYPFFRPGCSLPSGIGMFPCPSFPRTSSSFANPSCSHRFMSRPYCCSTLSPLADNADVNPPGLNPCAPNNPVDIPDPEKAERVSTGPARLPDKKERTSKSSKISDTPRLPERKERASTDSRKSEGRAPVDNENTNPADNDGTPPVKLEKTADEAPIKEAPNSKDRNTNTSSVSTDSSRSEDLIAPVAIGLSSQRHCQLDASLLKNEKLLGASVFTDERQSPSLQLMDSEREQSLMVGKKESLNNMGGTELTHSASHRVDEDNSDTGIPQIEVSDTEQRSFFEKSTSSSLPDLERVRHGAIKGLRHRQSAPGQAFTDVSEDAPSSVSSELTGARRIEAASGDSPQNQRTSPQGIRIVQLGRGQQQDREQPGHFTVDATFLLMLVLSVATVLILLNRIFHMVDWSDVLTKL
ncbi:hypothetical protein Btru_062566 [Bulinus truncatus]|nr:hypothetical protein Btru_062566 [Bulinus truncatus]